VPTPPDAAKMPAHLTIKLASEPLSADVYRMPQGVRIGTTPLVYSMDAIEGEVVLIVKKRGYVDQQLVVPADRDTDRIITLTHVATRPHEPKPPSPGAGSTSSGEPPGGSLDPFDKLAPDPKRP
jgi:hypothetical protein